MKRPKTLLEIREKDLISRSDEQAYNLQVFQRFSKFFENLLQLPNENLHLHIFPILTSFIHLP